VAHNTPHHQIDRTMTTSTTQHPDTWLQDGNLIALAADGMLFRRCHAALVDPANTSFADSMDRLIAARTSDDPPTLDELRALLTEALK
jgi:hypothetical protein